MFLTRLHSALDFVPSFKLGNILQTLVTSYSESHRFYHGIDHIDRMLGGWHTLCLKDLPQPTPRVILSVELAIIYHDVVYIPGAKNNEVLSIERLMTDTDYPSSLPDVIGSAARMIRLTQDYFSINPSEVDDYEAAFLNLDLMHLASPYEQFCKYQNDVIKEYSVLAPESVVRKKQSEFLMKLQDKGRVFFPTRMCPFINRLEDSAKVNIERFYKEAGS